MKSVLRSATLALAAVVVSASAVAASTTPGIQVACAHASGQRELRGQVTVDGAAEGSVVISLEHATRAGSTNAAPIVGPFPVLLDGRGLAEFTLTAVPTDAAWLLLRASFGEESGELLIDAEAECVLPEVTEPSGPVVVLLGGLAAATVLVSNGRRTARARAR